MSVYSRTASLKTIADVTNSLLKQVQQSWAKLQCELGPDLLSAPIPTVAVALSGGRDSIALAYALKQLQTQASFRLIAFILDHQLQAQSAQWRVFCEQWCTSQNIEFISQTLQVQMQGDGVEAAARSARYKAFKQMAVTHKAHVLALGHHQDDQAETVLLQLARGTGLGGASAMPEMQLREGLLWWRPLLQTSRNEINGYVSAQNLDFIEDPSNTNTDFRRNAIRLQVLPALEQAFPQTKKSLAQFAAHAAQAQNELQAIAEQDYAQCLDASEPEAFWADFAHCTDSQRGPVLQLQELKKLSSPRQQRVLRCWMQKLGFAPIELAQMQELVSQCLDGVPQANPVVQFQGRMISRYRGRLYSYGLSVERKELNITFEAVSLVDESAFGIAPSVVDQKQWQLANRDGGETLKLALNRPSRTLKQHFQALGIPPWLRERVVILKVGGEVVWVQGIGFDARWASSEGERLVPFISNSQA
jgi:tRNA(Ile)-lysidine synthase